MAQGHYELKTAKDGQFMFNLIATNGQIILTSELLRKTALPQCRKMAWMRKILSFEPLKAINHISC